jgi:hypothetical protein
MRTKTHAKRLKVKKNFVKQHDICLYSLTWKSNLKSVSFPKPVSF